MMKKRRKQIRTRTTNLIITNILHKKHIVPVIRPYLPTFARDGFNVKKEHKKTNNLHSHLTQSIPQLTTVYDFSIHIRQPPFYLHRILLVQPVGKIRCRVHITCL